MVLVDTVLGKTCSQLTMNQHSHPLQNIHLKMLPLFIFSLPPRMHIDQMFFIEHPNEFQKFLYVIHSIDCCVYVLIYRVTITCFTVVHKIV